MRDFFCFYVFEEIVFQALKRNGESRAIINLVLDMAFPLFYSVQNLPVFECSNL